MENEIDPELLLNLVRDRPILWKMSLEEYHDRKKKQAAWMEVAEILYSEYDVMEEAVIERLGIKLSKKWKNLRDNYARYVKKLKLGNCHKHRKYIYANQMSFLVDTGTPAATQNNLDDDNDSEKNDELTDDDQSVTSAVCSREHSLSAPEQQSVPESSTPKTSSATEQQSVAETLAPKTSSATEQQSVPVHPVPSTSSVTEQQIVPQRHTPRISSSFPVRNLIRKSLAKRRKHMEENLSKNQSREIPSTATAGANSNEDQLFFDSVLPIIRQLNSNQKFEFRATVLSMVENIRNSNHPPPFNSTFGNGFSNGTPQCQYQECFMQGRQYYGSEAPIFNCPVSNNIGMETDRREQSFFSPNLQAPRSLLIPRTNPSNRHQEVRPVTEQREVLSLACKCLEQLHESKEMPTVVKVWGEKLITLDPQQRIFAEKAINDVLFEASLGNLHKNFVKFNEDPYPDISLCDRTFSTASDTPSLPSPKDDM